MRYLDRMPGWGDDSVRSTRYLRGCGAMAEMTPEGDEELARLRAENARLASLLDTECHHLSAFSFEAILKRAQARYVLGLTATPIRRDGRQPIIFMQCGPIRHTASQPAGAPQTLEVVPRYVATRIDLSADSGIQQVFRHVASDAARAATIAAEIASESRVRTCAGT